MNLSIPDGFYKILVFAGIGLFIYTQTQISSELSKSHDEQKIFNDERSQVIINIERLEMQRGNAATDASIYAFDNNIDILKRDTNFLQNIIQQIRAKRIDMKIRDSLLNLLAKVDELDVRIKENAKNGNYLEFIAKKRNEYSTELISVYSKMNILGIVLFIFGLLGIFVEEVIDSEKKIFLNRVERNKYKDDIGFYSNCQSCGRKFNALLKRGNEADNKINNAFCNECYQSGNFVEPDLSLTDIKLRFQKKSTKYNFFEKMRISKMLSNLERWNKRIY